MVIRVSCWRSLRRNARIRCCERAPKVNTIGWVITTSSGFRRCSMRGTLHSPPTHRFWWFVRCISPLHVHVACLAGSRLCCGTGRAAVLPTSPDRQHAPPVPRDVPIVNRVCRWSCMALIYDRAQIHRVVHNHHRTTKQFIRCLSMFEHKKMRTIETYHSCE